MKKVAKCKGCDRYMFISDGNEVCDTCIEFSETKVCKGKEDEKDSSNN